MGRWSSKNRKKNRRKLWGEIIIQMFSCLVTARTQKCGTEIFIEKKIKIMLTETIYLY